MLLKQSYTRHLAYLLQSLNGLIFSVFCIGMIVIIPVQLSFAEAIKYGPTKSGETLWKIAQRNVPDRSITIEQVAYAIYSANPAAFQSKNINQLLRGVTLNIPEARTILQTSNTDAKRFISVLQADAKQLSKAKKNSSIFSRKVRRYKKQLRKYRRNSRAWRRTYKKLSRSKRNLATSQRKVTRLNKLLSEKTNLKPSTPSIVKSPQQGNIAQNPSTTKAGQALISQEEIDKTNIALNKFTNKNAGGKTPVNNTIATLNSINDAPTTLKQAATPAPVNNNNRQKTDWFSFANENLIFIAGIINALILLFVLYKLFEKKEEPDFY